MKTVSLVLAWFLVTLQVAAAEEVDEVRYPILSGVGIALRVVDGSVYVDKVLPGTVAERSKAVHEGDQILAVQNGEQRVRVQGKPLGDVASLIRGPVGTQVTLELRPTEGASSRDVSLTREPIPIHGVATYREFVGQVAPELVFSRLDEADTRVKLSQFRGKIVVLDFWASWCGTCYPPVENLQKTSRAHPEWKDRVVLMAVSVDVEPADAAKVVRERKWSRTLNVSIDPESLESIGVSALPVLLVVSPEGKIDVMGGSHAMDVEYEVERLLRD